MDQNRFWALRFAAKLFFLLLLFLLIAFPAVMKVLEMSGRYPIALLPFIDAIQIAQTWAMRTIGMLWVFSLGSCFASFLNVVAWRVPRGRGINGSSHCPHCDVKLKFTDNLPVIGWIRIGGMCRNCKVPVSPRYLIVEIILGLIFVAVFATEVLSGGMNLPLRPPNHFRGFEHVVFSPKWDLIQLWAFQMVLACFLFTFSVIRSEKLRIPQSIFWVAIAMGIGFPLIWPAMLLVPWQMDVQNYVLLERFSTNQIMTMLAGITAGTLCGSLVWWIRSKQSNLFVALESNSRLLALPESIACLTLVGLFLGWQSVIVVTFGSMAILLAVSFFDRSPSPESDEVLDEAVAVNEEQDIATGEACQTNDSVDGDGLREEHVDNTEPETREPSLLAASQMENDEEAHTEAPAIDTSEPVPHPHMESSEAAWMAADTQTEIAPPKTDNAPILVRIFGNNPSSNFSAIVLATSVLHVLAWRYSNCLPGWPRGILPWLEISLAILALAALAVTLRRKLAFKLTS